MHDLTTIQQMNAQHHAEAMAKQEEKRQEIWDALDIMLSEYDVYDGDAKGFLDRWSEYFMNNV